MHHYLPLKKLAWQLWPPLKSKFKSFTDDFPSDHRKVMIRVICPLFCGVPVATQSHSRQLMLYISSHSDFTVHKGLNADHGFIPLRCSPVGVQRKQEIRWHINTFVRVGKRDRAPITCLQVPLSGGSILNPGWVCLAYVYVTSSCLVGWESNYIMFASS